MNPKNPAARPAVPPRAERPPRRRLSTVVRGACVRVFAPLSTVRHGGAA
ncbi:hypothetical protein [Longimicrobium sp.]|nr:hypothetical protein [Longimicrobium sp.]HEX6041855.1 hypothetical protein [Longimicrobium sp.]